ncbi:nitroreductase family protein [Rhodohalobacter sp. SW132]|uniref:nitroreductase family protein n=1 Tax=Rhodohalobacter sp. SW132 TaxID=2293433 RepID=UPI001F3F209F|nr:nitroreductase family protein [Rhodohalobacter sp. SW132]
MNRQTITETEMDLIDALNWRYAAKRMNGQRVPEEKVERIKEAIGLSASSMGLQPYSILTVTDDEMKKKIRAAAYNQPQVVEGSHILVFAAWKEINDTYIDEYMERISDVRGVSLESLADFRNSIKKMVAGNSEQQNHEWAARQIYIALGTGLTAAAVEKVDATPMEGFVPEKVDEILGLPAQGLQSVSLLVLGYRDEENDFLAGEKKVRREKEKLFVEV